MQSLKDRLGASFFGSYGLPRDGDLGLMAGFTQHDMAFADDVARHLEVADIVAAAD